MSGIHGHISRFAGFVALLVVSSLACAGCASINPNYPEQPISLIWEKTIKATSVRLYLDDTGAADIAPAEFTLGPLPVEYFDPQGKKTGELDLSLIPKHNSQVSLEFEDPTEFGRVGVDYNFTYERQATDGGSTGRRVLSDSVIEMVDRDGKTVWETPGLAQAYVFYVDNSLVACYGKDPSLLSDVPGDVMSTEYASEVVRRYELSPNRVLLLDAATGSVKAEFDLAAANLIPMSVITDSTTPGGTMILSTETQGDAPPIIGFSLNTAVDGRTVRSVDLRKALPNISLESLEYTPAGLFAMGEDGTVSRLDLDGKVLWTKTPKGGASVGAFNVAQTASVVWSSPEGLVMVEREEGGLYSTGPNSAAPFLAITVFDANGNVLLELDNLKRPVGGATEAPIAVAQGESPRIGEDYLYVFNMEGDKVTVSRARIPTATSLAVSPSGEYVLTLRNGSDERLTTSMYRLEGPNK